MIQYANPGFEQEQKNTISFSPPHTLSYEGATIYFSNGAQELNIVCVGDVTPPGGHSCDEHYTLEQLQQKCVDVTNSFSDYDNQGNSFHQNFLKFRIWIDPRFPDTFIQQSYDNDKIIMIVELPK